MGCTPREQSTTCGGEWASSGKKGTCFFRAAETLCESSLHFKVTGQCYPPPPPPLLSTRRHVDTQALVREKLGSEARPTDQSHDSNALEFEGVETRHYSRLVFRADPDPTLPLTTTTPLPPREQPPSCCRRRCRPRYLHGRHRQLGTHSELIKQDQWGIAYQSPTRPAPCQHRQPSTSSRQRHFLCRADLRHPAQKWGDQVSGCSRSKGPDSLVLCGLPADHP